MEGLELYISRHPVSSISLLPAGSSRGIFSDIHCEDLVELQEVKLTTVGPPMTRSSWSSQLSDLSCGNSSITVNISLPQHWFP